MILTQLTNGVCNCKVILTIVVLRVIWKLYLMHLFRGGVTHLKNRSRAALFIVNLLQKYLAILIFNAKMQMLLF